MAGYQGTSTRKNAHEAFAAATEAERREINTVLDGTVVSYDRNTQLATIQPKLKRKFGDKELTAPPLEKIKVVQAKGGGHGVHVDLAAGDPVTLHFRQRNTDASQTGGGDADGAPGRMNDLSDAIAIPGGGPDDAVQTNMPAGGAHFGKNDGKVGLQTKADGSAALVGGPSGAEKLTISPSGKVDIKGEDGDSLLQIVKDLATVFRNHTNTGAAVDAPFVTAANAIIARIDTMKA